MASASLETSNMTTYKEHACIGACYDSIDQMPVDSIIRIMESKAYSLAREGRADATNALFIAVAALEKCREGDLGVRRFKVTS